MSLVVTNGENYVWTAISGKVNICDCIEDADIYPNVYQASKVITRATMITRGYYVYDTETQKVCWKPRKRKIFSKAVRKRVYDKSNGCCELCGEKIKRENMTLDHIVPLTLGGADEEENLQCACKPCNSFKGQILPEDFNDKIASIFIYQMKKKHSGKMKWMIVNQMLNGMM